MDDLPTQVHGECATASQINKKLEVVPISASNEEQSKRPYGKPDLSLDAAVAGDRSRIGERITIGPACSIQCDESLVEKNLKSTALGSAQRLHFIVSALETARDNTDSRGIAAIEVLHCLESFSSNSLEPDGCAGGPSLERSSYRIFISFRDQHGNGWLLYEIVGRLAGSIIGNATFGSAEEVSGALRRAAAARGRHEPRLGSGDIDWADWYGGYLFWEQAGKQLSL